MADLAAFLDRAGRTRFAWGAHDCSLLLADWLVENGYADPAAHLRARYATALGCARLLKRQGGLLAVVADCAKAAGLTATNTPNVGAVGVIETMTMEGRQMVGAICTGPRWAMLGVQGLVSLPAVPLAAWTV